MQRIETQIGKKFMGKYVNNKVTCPSFLYFVFFCFILFSINLLSFFTVLIIIIKSNFISISYSNKKPSRT